MTAPDTAKKAPAKRPPRKTGRPTKLNDDIQKKILDAVRAGIWLDQASALAGIAPSSLYLWADKGQRARELAELEGKELTGDDLKYAEFSDALKKARAEAEARNVMQIQNAAANGTWQASAWFLERSFPQRWGRTDRMEVTGKDGGSVEVSISVADLEAKVVSLLSTRTNKELE